MNKYYTSSLFNSICILALLIVSFSQSANAQWNTLVSGTTEHFSAVDFVSANTGFAVTDDFVNGGKIFKTTNGTTWSQVYTSPNYLFTVHFISASTGWAAGGVTPNGVIMKTTNGGATWTVQTTSVKQILSICFVDENDGWAVGIDGTVGTHFIYHSSNGGTTWTQQSTGFDYLRTIDFANTDEGIAAGDNGQVYTTSNGGATWTQQTFPVFHISTVKMVNSSVAYVAGAYGNGGVYKSTNGGTNWTSQMIPTILGMSGVDFVNPDTGLVVGENGKVLFTSNGGSTWTAQNSGVTDWLSSVKFENPNSAYAVGSNGRIIKFGTTTGIPTVTREVSDQIYPNPASGKVFFSNELSNAESLSISDLNGKEMMKVDRDFLETADGLNIESLNSGVYFVSIRYATESAIQKLIVQ
jgi:photosystem II stability/assembly factor-like uncharacterized protein